MIVRAFANKDTFCITANQIDNAGSNKAVIQHHIGALHQVKCAESKQVRVARTSANQKDFAYFLNILSKGSGVQFFKKLFLCTFYVARQKCVRNWAVAVRTPQLSTASRPPSYASTMPACSSTPLSPMWANPVTCAGVPKSIDASEIG